MINMAFNPVTGLIDSATYVSKPASGTGAGSARDQVQGRLNEVRDYINNTLVADTNKRILRNYMEV